jgi:putative ABC transport system permease protein
MIAPGRGERLLWFLLYLYPPSFRRRFGAEMRLFLRDDRGDEPLWRLWVGLLADAATQAAGEWATSARGWLTRPSMTGRRERERGHLMYSTLQDLRAAVRGLMARPGFTAIALATITLGIGAASVVFTLVNGVLFRPLPYAEPQALVKITGLGAAVPGRPVNLSRPDFLDFSGRNHTFDRLGLHDSAIGAVTVTGSGDAERVRAVKVSAGFFGALRTVPALGRLTTPEEDATGASVIVISHGFWLRHFGGEATVINQAITLNQVQATVIGVLPDTFRYPQPEAQGDPDVYGTMPFSPPPPRSSRSARAIGRLKPGVTLGQAQADLAEVATQLQREHPQDDFHTGVVVRPLLDAMVGDTKPALWLLLASVAVVLLIGCANLANLLLARNASRERELAVRAALGASRLRLIRQLLADGLVLSTAGGVLAASVGYSALRAIVSLGHANLPRAADVSLDTSAFGVFAAVSVVAGLIAGGIPAVKSSGWRLEAALRRGGRHGHDVATQSTRTALVVVEVGLATMLLIGAGLLLRSFAKLEAVNPGFATAGRVTAQVSLPASRYAPDAQVRFFDGLYQRVSALPGVGGVAAVNILPLSGGHSCDAIRIDDHPTPTGQSPCAETRSITPGYFEVMDIPILRGRAFIARDDERAAPVVIVNGAMAARFWPGVDPVGRTVTLVSLSEQEAPRQIVGVVANTAHLNLTEEPVLQYYVPQHQPPTYQGTTMVVKTEAGAPAVAAAMRGALKAMDPQLALYNVRSLDELTQAVLGGSRFQTVMVGGFAGVALLLAVAGVYGILAFFVNQRVHEIGLRLCLGAARGSVLWMVIRRGMTPVLLGLAAGVLAALAAARFAGSLLFGIAATDLPTFIAVPAVLALSGLLACYLPARRAMAVDPALALRSE